MIDSKSIAAELSEAAVLSVVESSEREFGKQMSWEKAKEGGIWAFGTPLRNKYYQFGR